MDNLPPIASPTENTVPSNEINLPALARAQRWFWPGMMAHLASIFAYMANNPAGAAHAPGAAHGLFTALQLGFALFTAFVVGKLGSALKIRWAWLATILAMFALLGFVVLISINKLAVSKLRGAGYKVGVFGSRAP